MDPEDPISLLFWLLALLAASAVFVAAEFAALSLRRRKVEQIARDEGVRAGSALTAAERAEEISLLTQLGSIVCLLLLGVLAAELGEVWLTRMYPAAATALALGIAAVIYLVFGQQIPRLLGAQRPFWIANPPTLFVLRILAFLLRPLLAVLSWSLEGFARALDLTRSALYTPVHTLEDIRDLVAHGHEQGVVEEEEREMIRGVFEFSDTVAREVMTPRIDVVAVPTQISLAELVEKVVAHGHSRVPVYEGSIDNVVGVLLVKDLLPLMAEDKPFDHDSFDVTELMREPYFVPDSKPVVSILAEFQQMSVHLAIVIDEFGGTYGLVTMEDLLEEIVGEIHDEYDVEEPEFTDTPEGDVLVDGGVSISEVNDRYGLQIPEEDFDTIGGYIFGALGRVPVVGDRIELGIDSQEVLEVEEAEDRRVTRVRIRRSGPITTPEL